MTALALIVIESLTQLTCKDLPSIRDLVRFENPWLLNETDTLSEPAFIQENTLRYMYLKLITHVHTCTLYNRI